MGQEMTDKPTNPCEIVIENGYWYLMEVGTCRMMALGPLPVPDKYKALEAK